MFSLHSLLQEQRYPVYAAVEKSIHSHCCWISAGRSPTLISRDYRHKDVLGQSWDGANFRVKHKCPVCDSVYVFNVVSEDGSPNWFIFGELEPGRGGNVLGNSHRVTKTGTQRDGGVRVMIGVIGMMALKKN